jgi:hypothetical protein
MEERFEISFSEGGVGTLETIITAGLAKAVEKTLDIVTGDDNHGWDCTIKDTITELKVTCWGVTKEEAQEKALKEIWEEIEDFENEREKEEEEEREHEKERIRLEEEEAERKRISESSSNNESSTEKGCAKIIAWIVGIGLAAYLVIWLAINIVLPVALLNSALILTILSFVFKKQKKLFASLSLFGGVYMLLDATNGWFSANFVEDVVKDPVWISAFIYINAAAIGLSVWSLIKPVWMRTEQIDPTEKRKKIIIRATVVLLIIVSIAIVPLMYHILQNSQNDHISNISNISTKNKVMTMTFKDYATGDNAYLVFEEVSTHEEYYFMITSDTRNKFIGLELLLEDEYSEFGEVANPKYINKKFVVEVTSEIIEMNGPEGEVIIRIFHV